MALPAPRSTLLTDPYEHLPLIITSATPSPPPSPAPSASVLEACLSHDISILGESNTLFPASRARLAEHSGKFAAMIEQLTLNKNVISVPEEDWVINEILRWTNCTGLFVEPLDTQPIKDKGLRLAILLHAADKYEISVAVKFLSHELRTQDFVRNYPVVALVIGVKGRLADVQREAEEVLNSYPLPPIGTDTTGLQLWRVLTVNERNLIFMARRRRTRNLQDKIFEFVNRRIEDWTCNLCYDAGGPPAGWTTWEKNAIEEVVHVPTHTNVIAKCYIAKRMEESGCKRCRQKLDEAEGIKALKELEDSIKAD